MTTRQLPPNKEEPEEILPSKAKIKNKITAHIKIQTAERWLREKRKELRKAAKK